MSSARSRSAGSSIGDHVEAVEQVGAEAPAATSRSRSRFVAATTRTSICVGVSCRRRDTNSPSWSSAQQLGLHRPAPSRRSRRGRGCRRRPARSGPARAVRAPVNAPRCVAEQLALEQVRRDGGAVDRDERLVARAPSRRAATRATSSLPVPVSPVMSTVQRVSATLASIDSAGSRAGSAPSICGACWSRHASASVSGSFAGVGLRTRPDRLLQRANLERFDQEVARAGVHRAHRIGDLRAAAHRDDRGPRRMHAGGSEDLEAGDFRHADVRQDQVEALFLQAGVAADAVHRDNFMTRRPAECGPGSGTGNLRRRRGGSCPWGVRSEAGGVLDPTQVSHVSSDLRELFLH